MDFSTCVERKCWIRLYVKFNFSSGHTFDTNLSQILTKCLIQNSNETISWWSITFFNKITSKNRISDEKIKIFVSSMCNSNFPPKWAENHPECGMSLLTLLWIENAKYRLCMKINSFHGCGSNTEPNEQRKYWAITQPYTQRLTSCVKLDLCIMLVFSVRIRMKKKKFNL